MLKKNWSMLVIVLLIVLGTVLLAVIATKIDRNEPTSVYCTLESRNQEVCTAHYDPVCGWFNTTKVQCLKYPCAITTSNACEACKSSDIIYWTKGACPS